MLQVLKEEAEAAGVAVPDDPTDEQLEAWCANGQVILTDVPHRQYNCRLSVLIECILTFVWTSTCMAVIDSA